MMIETGEIRHDECICEPCLDVSPNWMDMRSEFEYTTLSKIDFEMRLSGLKTLILWKYYQEYEIN